VLCNRFFTMTLFFEFSGAVLFFRLTGLLPHFGTALKNLFAFLILTEKILCFLFILADSHDFPFCVSLKVSIVPRPIFRPQVFLRRCVFLKRDLGPRTYFSCYRHFPYSVSCAAMASVAYSHLSQAVSSWDLVALHFFFPKTILLCLTPRKVLRGKKWSVPRI